MHKNILLFISFVLFSLLVYLYNISTELSEDDTRTNIIQLEKEQNQTPKVLIELNTTVKKSPKTLKIKPSIPKPTAISTPKKIMLYESLSLEEAQLSSKARKDIRPVSAIHINHTTLKELKVQDTIVLADIEGVDYPLTVTYIQTNNDGSITTTSSYTDEGISYTTTMTLSEDESFISLATAQGLYEIETNDGVGYVYKTSDIRKKMQQSTADDVIIFPIPKTNLGEE